MNREIEEGTDLREEVVAAFREQYGREPQILVRAPGRVNLLGAHVDYNEGWVLPAATDRAVWLAAARSDGDETRVLAMDMAAHAGFSLNRLTPRDRTQKLDWSDYARGVAWVLLEAGYELPYLDIAFSSNVPIGAGVSSSAAVEIAFIAAWDALADLKLSGLDKARLGQQVENHYVGLASGIMDQFASVHGAENQLVLLDCRTLEHELIPLPPEMAILVADSGIRRELAASKYNERRSECEESVSLLKAYLPDIKTLRDVTVDDFELYAHRLPITLRRRAQHVVEECARVLEGARVLRNNDIIAFGRLLRRSHASSRDLYEISIPELDLLAATAWQTDGAYGARLTGAGFGGMVVVLAHEGVVGEVAATMRDAYEVEFGRTPAIFTVHAADGVRVFPIG